MNLHGIRVVTEAIDESNPKHRSLRIEHTAHHDPPRHVIPEHITDQEYLAARIRAAGILARLAALAQPHIESERRAHGCGTYVPGEPLTRDLGWWNDACQSWTFDLDPNGDGSMPVAVYLDVPVGRVTAWRKACKTWLTDLAAQDSGQPPAPPAHAHNVHQLRAVSTQ